MEDGSGQEVTILGIREQRWMGSREGILNAYRCGDPLRTIARDMEGSVEDICLMVARSGRFGDELERSRSIRRRSVATTDVLDANVDMIGRLASAGFGRPEIPVVLNALDINIDVEVAVELLHSPCIPRDSSEQGSLPRRLSDRLSLLYVAGKHHGIEPDYQLALGQMPIDEIIELRALMEPFIPPRRFAEILAVAETTKIAIRARVVSTLSLTDYKATAERQSRRLGSHLRGNIEPWPVPAPTLRRRLGRGYWYEALSEVGLKIQSSKDRFGDQGYVQALLDYAAECRGFELPVSIETYDRWVLVEASVGCDRPSVVEFTTEYGSWKAALRKILGQPDDRPHRQGSGSDDALHDGPLYELIDSAEAAWVRAGEYICELLASMPRNRSLQIQYGDPVDGSIQPYAQATRGADGVWCEIVSDQFLPGHQWPIDTEYLGSDGWLTPDDEVPQWCKEKVPFPDAGHQILKGLRFGRLCPDPWQLRWSTRDLISGSGPDHGVTMEDALAGEVQTLRNAS